MTDEATDPNRGLPVPMEAPHLPGLLEQDVGAARAYAEAAHAAASLSGYRAGLLASIAASLANFGGTKTTETFAPVASMASFTEPKTGSSMCW